MMQGVLSRENFSAYPPQGREIAASHLDTLQRTPLPVLPAFLRELKEYDWKFPIEQRQIVRRIDFLQANPESVAAFSQVSLPANLRKSACVEDPQRFLAKMTAHLWSSLQMDRYRQAAAEFSRRFQSSETQADATAPRVVIVLIGQGANAGDYAPFEKLRPHGLVRTQVNAAGAAELILDVMRKRATELPTSYAHWYIDGGNPLFPSPPSGVTQLVYPALAPVKDRILEHILAGIQNGQGPEALQEELSGLNPANLCADKASDDPRMPHSVVSLLCEGSGTQIFSTSFAQWSARETLRRAQPETLVLRFAPRQRQQSFNAMVLAASGTAQLDVEGSLIDADMGAYYTYLETMNLPGADEARFLVWFEGHPDAFVAGPGVAKGTSSATPVSMQALLSDMLSPA
jgi:hypothetical protein